MWNDFNQEETRSAKSGNQRHGVDEEENVFLTTKGKKKAKKGSSSGAKQKRK